MNSPVVERLIAVNPAAYREIVPRGGPSAESRRLLERTTVDDLFPAIARPVYAFAALGALWLRNDALDEAHTIVQQSPEQILAGFREKSAKGATNGGEYDSGESTLAFWHGIMHRREGDFGNAKYWFRRVGSHPVLDAIREAVGTETELQSFRGEWEPFRFVDLCEQAERSQDSAAKELLVRVGLLEWDLLFEYCCLAAVEG